MPSRTPTVQAGTHHMPWLSLPVDLGSVYFIFYCWLSQVQAGHSVYAGNRAQHFLGCVLGEESCVAEVSSLCMLPISPPNPTLGSKQSLLLGVKIPFLLPCLAFVEDTLAHSIDEALFLQCRHGVVAHECDNCVLQSFRARVPERYLHVTLRGQPSMLLVFGPMVSRLVVKSTGLQPLLLMVFTCVGPNTSLN